MKKWPMWRSCFPDTPQSDAVAYFLFSRCCDQLLILVQNYLGETRWWTDGDPFVAHHPAVALWSSPSSQSCQSSQLHRLSLVKSSPSTCQLIDGVEVASLDHRCSSAPPTKQDDPASPLTTTYFFCASPSVLGAHSESWNTYVSSATWHNRLALPPSLCCPLWSLTSALQFSRGTDRCQNGKLPL